MNMVVLIFDNNVYGLTKKQMSPTSPLGFKNNTAPRGTILQPLNPLTVTLGITNVSFVAQTIDWNPAHLYATLQAAHNHRGTSFVRILQRCPVYSDEVFSDIQNDPSKILFLNHKNGIHIGDNVKRLFPTQREHDPSNMSEAYDIARNHVPVGLLYHAPQTPCYEDFSSVGRHMGIEDKMKGLNDALDQFAV
jgi:2-oxoglutarate ferredoxin oxidoreductase subunit beta